MSTTGNNERFWSAPTGRRFRFLLGLIQSGVALRLPPHCYVNVKSQLSNREAVFLSCCNDSSST
jgi:hypothetical protein